MKPSPTTTGIEAAFRAIDPVFRDSPLLCQATADAVLHCRLWAKVETLNPIRSFKGRGADWFVRSLTDARPLVAASAGNFGQGLAYAARKSGRQLTIFAATTANSLKVEAMRRLGAQVILEGADFDAAKQASRAYAAQHGAMVVEDGAAPCIAEGAGTIALEMTRGGRHFDTLLVPLGNGALLTGIGTWMRQEAPGTRTIGVVADAAPSMLLSWQQDRTVPTTTAATIADGIAVREPVPYALACMRSTVDEVWSVSDDAIRGAMRFCLQHYGLVVEPAGAAGVAAVLAHGARVEGQTVATILCGGNVTTDQMRDWFC